MILRALLPWLLGWIALGIGYLAVGNSLWLLAFVVPSITLGYVWVWPRW